MPTSKQHFTYVCSCVRKFGFVIKIDESVPMIEILKARIGPRCSAKLENKAECFLRVVFHILRVLSSAFLIPTISSIYDYISTMQVYLTPAMTVTGRKPEMSASKWNRSGGSGTETVREMTRFTASLITGAGDLSSTWGDDRPRDLILVPSRLSQTQYFSIELSSELKWERKISSAPE